MQIHRTFRESRIFARLWASAMMSACVTRFAPSPNGSLHLGHAFSAIRAHDLAQRNGGKFLLRIEDIDGGRSRPDLPPQFRADLDWLGLEWTEVAPQSTRIAGYAAAAANLRAAKLLYPCKCTRAQIQAAASHTGPDGPIYPGTCRRQPIDVDLDAPVAWRLDIAAAMQLTGPLSWTDQLAGQQQAHPELLGDVVLMRKDPATPASYHLAVTLDDASDGVTLVTRGLDLFASTHVHRLLQALLGLPVPVWHHHPLLIDTASGSKLAKSRGSPSLTSLRLAGEDGRALAERLRTGQSPAGIVIADVLNQFP